MLTLIFSGSLAIAFLTLLLYPFLYAQDVSSADAYRVAPVCGASSSNNCRAQLSAVASNVRSSDGQPEFDVVIGAKTVSVIKDSGGYSPQNGDSVQLEMWRGQPVRVFGPGAEEMTTDQYPQSRLKTDQDVLGFFLFLGFFAVAVAVLTGWFGRRLIFYRLIGYSRPQVLGGFAIVLVVAVVTVPIVVVGEASGWLPPGRAGGTIVGLAIVGVILVGVGIYRLIRRLRSA